MGAMLGDLSDDCDNYLVDMKLGRIKLAASVYTKNGTDEG